MRRWLLGTLAWLALAGVIVLVQWLANGGLSGP